MQVPSLLMTSECIMHPYLGATPSGFKYGTPFASMCRFEPYSKVYKDMKGKEFISLGKLFLLPTDENLALKKESQVVIDDDTYTIKDIKILAGFSISHLECVVS